MIYIIMSKNIYLKTIILKSNHIDYIEKKNKKLLLLNKIGEGTYGLVYLLDNNHVIKIFKNSSYENTILEESNYLMPLKNENRELVFYFTNKTHNNYIINLYAIGLIKEPFLDDKYKIDIHSYFIILPYCIPFYEKYEIWNKPLIKHKNGIDFVVNVMKRLLEISYFIEKKYEIFNLDFKLNNFMFSKDSYDLNDLIMIDFSIIKKKIPFAKYNNKNNKYYIWPNDTNILLETIPSYSISINGLELLYGYEFILEHFKKNKINKLLLELKNINNSLYNIFDKGLVIKINTENFLNQITKFLEEL